MTRHSSIAVGSIYPEFQLEDHQGHSFASSSLHGRRSLLYWYPKASSCGCTVQAEGLRDQHEVFRDLSCRIIGLSPDPPLENHIFHTDLMLTFPLLSDEYRTLASMVDAVSEDGTVSRVAHLLDEHGVVLYIFDHIAPESFAEDALDVLESLA